VRGDWATTRILWEIDLAWKHRCNTARDTFHPAQEHFLFGGLSPPNKK
jgi:hypothetical protein